MGRITLTFASVALTACVATPSRAAEIADQVAACAMVADDDVRLKCFDFVAKQANQTATLGTSATAPAVQEPAPAPSQTPNPTPTRVSLAKSPNVRRLTAGDLAVETHKWEGTVVETALNCLYADVSEFRCVDLHSFARVRVDFNSFDTAGENYLTAHCDTENASGSRACFVKIRFEYEGFHTQDGGGMVGNITFVHPKDGYGEIVK